MADNANRVDVVNIFEIHDLDCQKGTVLIEKCQELGLLPKPGSLKCPKCGNTLHLRPNKDSIDGFVWLCNGTIRKPKKKAIRCIHRQSIRTGTFFEKSHLKIWEILVFVTLWLNNIEQRFIKCQLKITDHTSTDWASYCRAVCYDIMMTMKKKIGGPGKTVQIDDCNFGKRKDKNGQQIEGQWVVSGIDVETGEAFMVAVEDRGRDTLIPIIIEWILPGTTIVSDYWKANDCLNTEGYEQLKVNHSINFKDPVTRVHTNAIERNWKHAKANMLGHHRKKESFTGYLAKYTFLKMCNAKNLDPATEFFRGAGMIFNPAQMQPTEN